MNTPLHAALEKQAAELAAENEAQLRRLADACRLLTPDSPCYHCGTGEPLQECSGCRAARLMEQRQDRDREES